MVDGDDDGNGEVWEFYPLDDPPSSDLGLMMMIVMTQHIDRHNAPDIN